MLLPCRAQKRDTEQADVTQLLEDLSSLQQDFDDSQAANRQLRVQLQDSQSSLQRTESGSEVSALRYNLAEREKELSTLKARLQAANKKVEEKQNVINVRSCKAYRACLACLFPSLEACPNVWNINLAFQQRRIACCGACKD